MSDCAVILDVFNPQCVARKAIDRIADRWTILVFLALKDGTLRFNEIKKALRDVSQKMLTQTLRNLERDGLLQREVIATVPVTVKYTLTPMGFSLLGIIEQLREWAYAHALAMHASSQGTELTAAETSTTAKQAKRRVKPSDSLASSEVHGAGGQLTEHRTELRR